MSQTPSCRTCGASLAPDQRYCLSCGTRAAAPRLDFLAEAERAEAEARAGGGPEGSGGAASAARPGAGETPATVLVPAAVAPAQPLSRLDRIGGPMGAAAVVLVALGIGFLIGQTRGEEPPAQRAPVVNIEGGLPAGGAAPATDVTVDETTVDDASAGGPGGDADAPASDAGAAGDDSGGSTAPPTETETPGAAPPVDDRAAGDGTEAETIG